MKKTILTLFIAALLAACSKEYPSDYTTKGTYCYQLAPQDQQPGKNCIGSGGH